MPVQRTPPRTLRPRENQSQTLKPTSIPQAIKKSPESNKKKISNENTTDKLSKEIQKLKSAIETQKNLFETSIDEMKNEMKEKCAKYESIIEAITRDIHQIKKEHHKTSEFLYTINSTRLNFALPIGFNKTIEANGANSKNSNNEINTILNRMLDIENKNSNLEKMIKNANELIEGGMLFNNCNAFGTKINVNTSEHEDYVNDFKCINDELNKINVAVFKSEEKISKM